MTQEPQLSPEKVAELERRLADAAAEVAHVQAQLQQASGTPNPAAPAPGPQQITIDGQPAAPGTGNLFQLLQQLGPAASGAGPVVVVNGQTVSGGQPIDLSSYLDPQTADRVRASLDSLGFGHHYGALFGLSPAGTPTGATNGGPPPGSSSVVARLADPPRPVPLAYRLATFDLSFYELFLLVILTTAPVIVWILLPVVVPAALLLALATIAWFRGRRYRRRIGLLRWGRVATVTNSQLLSQGTYYSGMTYNNMRKRSATGWRMTTQWYSGPAYTNQVDYSIPEGHGTLKYRGLRYADGVVLADSRDPSRAMTVEQFPYQLEPGPDGQLPGRLSPWMWVGIVVTLGVEIGLVVAMISAVLGLWVNA